MKKITYLISLVLSILINSCQSNDKEIIVPEEQLQNNGFELWEEVNNFDKPESWNTSNFSLYNIVTFNTVMKENTNPFSGNYCVKLETKSQIINTDEVKVVGLITLGNFDINIATRKAKISGGIPFITRPISFKGNYKYSPIGIDSCFMDIALTKYNFSLNRQDTIAQGRFSSSTANSWKEFLLPIKYRSVDIPDSMNIIILSSDTSIFEAGSTLWIDELSLVY
jgi:hypothetical protein